MATGPVVKQSGALIALLGALTAFASLSTDMYLPSLPAMARALHASTGAAQATMAVFLAGLALGQLVYGPLSDRVGRRPLILSGLTMYLVASVVCALAPSIEVMLVGRLFQAIGASAGVVLATVVVRDVYPSERVPKVMNGLVLIMGLSPALAPAIGAGILLIAGWRTIFWILIVITALVLARTFLALGETRSAATKAQAEQEHPLRSYLTLFGNTKLMGYFLVNALAGGMLFAYLAGSPALIIQVFGFSPQAYSGVVAANTVAIIIGAIIGTTLVAKVGLDRMIAAGNAAAIVFTALLMGCAVSGIGGHWGFLALIFLTLTSFGPMSANCIAGALTTDALRSGSISAMMNSGPFIGAGLAAWVSGALWDHTARPMAGTMLACMLLAAAALWLMVMGKKQATTEIA